MENQKTASERRKERDSFTNNSRFQEAKVPSIIRKFFFYDNERISGTTYFLRFIPIAFILFFGLEFFELFEMQIILIITFSYLLSVIAYKRAKSISKNNILPIFFAVWGLTIVSLPQFGIEILPILNLLHLYLIFKNKPSKN